MYCSRVSALLLVAKFTTVFSCAFVSLINSHLFSLLNTIICYAFQIWVSHLFWGAFIAKYLQHQESQRHANTLPPPCVTYLCALPAARVWEFSGSTELILIFEG